MYPEWRSVFETRPSVGEARDVGVHRGSFDVERLEAGAASLEQVRERARVDKLGAMRVVAAKAVDGIPVARVDLARARHDLVVELARERLRQGVGLRVDVEVVQRDEAAEQRDALGVGRGDARRQAGERGKGTEAGCSGRGGADRASISAGNLRANLELN